MMIPVLLAAIVLLLVAVVVLLLTGWPGREERAIEEIGREMRKELAQHRADSVQLLHAMRIDLDDSLRETMEAKLEALSTVNSRLFDSRKKLTPAQQQQPWQNEEQLKTDDTENPHSSRRNGYGTRSAVDERQLMLFSGEPEEAKPDEAALLDTTSVKSAASFTCTIDDIPEIEYLPDYDDL
ncbi:MAG: hypothetical protein HGB23_04555 [Chlorobiaceae bacterium]|nr:hypothetical protein [Chlorobiaceae bacterium]